MNKSRTHSSFWEIEFGSPISRRAIADKEGKEVVCKLCAGYVLHNVARVKVLGYSLPVKDNAICSRDHVPFFQRL